MVAEILVHPLVKFTLLRRVCSSKLKLSPSLLVNFVMLDELILVHTAIRLLANNELV